VAYEKNQEIDFRDIGLLLHTEKSDFFIFEKNELVDEQG